MKQQGLMSVAKIGTVIAQTSFFVSPISRGGEVAYRNQATPNGSFLSIQPLAVAKVDGRNWPASERWPARGLSHFGLLRHLKRVVNFDAEVANRALQLRVAQQQLHCAKVLGSAIDKRCLGPPHSVGAVRCVV